MGPSVERLLAASHYPSLPSSLPTNLLISGTSTCSAKILRLPASLTDGEASEIVQEWSNVVSRKAL